MKIKSTGRIFYIARDVSSCRRPACYMATGSLRKTEDGRWVCSEIGKELMEFEPSSFTRRFGIVLEPGEGPFRVKFKAIKVT